MSTRVKQAYHRGFAVSTTTRNRRVVKVTTWSPGNPGTTHRVESV